MRLSAEQKRKKRERKEAKAARRAAEPVVALATRSMPEKKPLLGDILGCWLSNRESGQGMLTLWVVRARTAGGVRLACFLIDTYCLGVKDAFWRDHSRKGAATHLEMNQARFATEAVAPPLARRLLDEAVGYALGLGLPPHPDYARSAEILQDVSPDAGPLPVSFGRDGKPFYISHPDEPPARCRQVIQALLRTRGPEGFHYVLLPHQLVRVLDLLPGSSPRRLVLEPGLPALNGSGRP